MQSKGYLLEVDLEYPQELHDYHNDFPLAPENIIPKSKYLSKLQNDYLLNKKPTKIPKLIMSLNNKERYVLFHENLAWYLKQGLILKKVHRVIEFEQKAWMEPYIRFNTEKRTLTNAAFEKDFYKLLNNSVFGKTMENVSQYKDVRLLNNRDQIIKFASKPTCDTFSIINQNIPLVAMHMNKPTITFNKPTYCGAKILDLSKLHMYQFVYEYLKPKYGKNEHSSGVHSTNIKILYTDTDSIVCEIITKNLYADMKEDNHLFDMSEYPKNHICYSEVNKKVIGKFKDELNGEAMIEHCALRPKMYCHTKTDTETEDKIKQENIKRENDQREIEKLLKQLGSDIKEKTSVITERQFVKTERKAKGVKKCVAKKFIQWKHTKMFYSIWITQLHQKKK